MSRIDPDFLEAAKRAYTYGFWGIIIAALALTIGAQVAW